MYLSELFLQVYKEEQSVLEALIQCDLELRKKLKNNLEPENIVDYYLKEGDESSRRHFAELFDFMDVYCNVSEEVSVKEREENDICILYIAEEVKGMYHIRLCDELPMEWSLKEKENLELLCLAIEDIRNAKYIVFLKESGRYLSIYCSLSLNEFARQFVNYGYFEVKYRLIELLQDDGLAIVVAGERGLAPRRLYGFELKKREWKPYPKEKTEFFGKQVCDVRLR